MASFNMTSGARASLPFSLCAALTLYFSHRVFGVFFPNANGFLGADYTYFLPRLLDGEYWFAVNGIWETPWFTPSFCGGLPFFGNPQSMYYSVPQALAIFFGPLKAVYYTFLAFQLAGFAGFYLLMRGPFGAARSLSLLGAALFTLNGFYAHRMIVGHFAFHAYPLLSLACYFTLRPIPGEGSARRRRFILDSAAAAIIFAVMIHSGMLELGLPAGAAVALVGVFSGALRGRDGDFWGRFALSGLIALALGASRLAATVAFMDQFTRSFYSYPGGIKSAVKLAWFVIQVLFFWPEKMLMYGATFMMGKKIIIHSVAYYEYSVTIVPLLLAIPAGYFHLRKWGTEEGRGEIKPAAALNLAAGILIVLAVASLLYSFEDERISAIRKSAPIIGAYTNMMCWMSALIPAAILAPLVLFGRIPMGDFTKTGVALLCAGVAALQVWSYDRSLYHQYHYDFRKIEAAHDMVRAGKLLPRVEKIVDQSASDWDRPLLDKVPMGGDDYLADCASQMTCYEPIFGYSFSKYPAGMIRPGAAMEVKDGFFNLKNPSCYSYPGENGCRPGDHFRIEQREMAENFRNYRPFAFHMSPRQRMADGITLVTLAALLSFAAYYAITFALKGPKAW
jgi:hypothetical protein